MRDPFDPSPGQKPEPESPAVGFWLRWRVVCLVAVTVLALPAARQATNWYNKSREVRDRQAARDATAAEFAKLQADQNAATGAARADLDRTTAAEQALVKSFQDATAGARKLLEDKDFAVRLTGPASVQPGAPNSWKVETLNRHGQPITPKKLELVVKDSAGTELLKDTQENPTAASSTVNLPLGFWAKVKPGTELFLHVAALTADDRKGVLEERVPLSRPVYITHLATDKPLYKPGETVRFRSLTLDRASLTPPAHDQHLRFRLRDPGDAVTPLDEGNGRLIANGQPVLGPDKKPLRGVGVGEYFIPTEAPGGEYKLDLYEVDHTTGREVLLETRKFLVNRYVPDTFEKKLEFDGKSYGAGDTVQARIEVSRTAGGPMKDARALVVATVDGREFFKQAGSTFAIVPADRGATKAVLDVRFKLPADLFEKNPAPSATLSVNIQDGSDVEPIVRPIPLVTKALKVEFFPEGGEMIAGVPGRVYFMVRNQHGKPADLKGVVTDGTKTIDVSTVTDAANPGVNRGHGVFRLEPEAGKKYFLKITSPAGIAEPTKEGFPLPEAKPDGVALEALDAVTKTGDAVRVRLQVGQGTKTLHVGAYARGRLIAHQKVAVTAGTPIDVPLKGDEGAGGVVRVTAFEEPGAGGEGRAALIPRAERLVFRNAEQRLILNASPDKARYTPAGKVRLELSAFNEKEQPVPAVLMVGVVNRSVITMADIKTDRLMPTHFLLSGEVRHPAELEHADFLLTDDPKAMPAAAGALDLLLGTQGWRRFAQQNPDRVNPADRPDVDRMLVAHGQQTSAPFALYKLEEQRVAAEFRPKLETAALARQAAQDAWNARSGDADAAAKVTAAQAAATTAEEKHVQAAADLHGFETRPAYPPTWWLPALAVALAGLALGGVPLAASRPSGARRPFVLGTVAAFALAGLTAAGVAWSWSTPEAEQAWAKSLNRQPKPGGLMAEAADGREMAVAMRREARAMPPAPMAAAPMAPPMGGAGGRGDRGAEPDALDAVALAGAVPQKALAEPKPEARPADAKFAEAKDEAKKFDDALRAGKGGARGDRAGEARNRQKEQLQKALAGGQAQPAGRPGRGPAPAAPGGPFADNKIAADFVPGAAPGFHLPAAVPFVVREYAHQRDPALGEVRSDFTETVFWHPVLVLPDSGKHAVEFQLADDIARYDVLVAGHTLDGRIGAVTKVIEARQPFSVDPKLPLEISHTDTIDMPVRVTNDSDEKRTVQLRATYAGLKPTAGVIGMIDLAANGKGRIVQPLKADRLSGQAAVGLLAGSGGDRDNILRAISIVPDGFPGVGTIADTIEKRASGAVKLPKDVVPGSLKVRLEMYPTSMADLVNGLDGLLREPSGCFEQTSTSNYPNTMILDYMNQTNQTNPGAAKRAKELLDRGYSKLVSFECPDTSLKGQKQGFEWFGGADRQHEALTAYGLLQFKDMSRVHTVDPQLIKRTQQFLLSRRDGQGGFKRNAVALDQFGGAPEHTTNAYIVWALVESDPEDAEKLDLTKEIQKLKTDALNADSVPGKDAYFVALTANVLLMRGDRAAAHTLLDRLKDKHVKDGAVTGAQTSITRSGGRTLDIETTALTLLGWLRANDPKYAAAVKDATKWLSQQRGGYGAYGSTQSTILALKALTLFAKKTAHPAESGELKLLVGGKEVAARKFGEKDVEVIGLDVADAEAVFKAGTSTDVEIVTDAKQAYPFALSYTYTSLTPVSAEKCAVAIATKLAKAEADEGDTVPLHLTFENKLDKDHGMAVAVVGIPAGMKVPTDMKQLTDLREKGTIAYFETRGRELVLYWRSLAPKQKIELTVDLVCDVPGVYRGPASRGYLYYDADQKHWVEPLAVTIRPMADEK
jgi:hypothetical protein